MLKTAEQPIRELKSTSSILEASSSASPSSGGISSSTISVSSATSISRPRPSLIIRWMREAWVDGSSRVNPEARRDVSYINITRSFTDLSFLSASAFLSELLHDGMIRIDLQVFLGCHVTHGGSIAKSLRFHDSFHVGGPTILRSDNTAR